jgi:hypothetical protein
MQSQFKDPTDNTCTAQVRCHLAMTSCYSAEEQGTLYVMSSAAIWAFNPKALCLFSSKQAGFGQWFVCCIKELGLQATSPQSEAQSTATGRE